MKAFNFVLLFVLLASSVFAAEKEAKIDDATNKFLEAIKKENTTRLESVACVKSLMDVNNPSVVEFLSKSDPLVTSIHSISTSVFSTFFKKCGFTSTISIKASDAELKATAEGLELNGHKLVVKNVLLKINDEIVPAPVAHHKEVGFKSAGKLIGDLHLTVEDLGGRKRDLTLRRKSAKVSLEYYQKVSDEKTVYQVSMEELFAQEIEYEVVHCTSLALLSKEQEDSVKKFLKDHNIESGEEIAKDFERAACKTAAIVKAIVSQPGFDLENFKKLKVPMMKALAAIESSAVMVSGMSMVVLTLVSTLVMLFA